MKKVAADLKQQHYAGVVKLADTLDLGSNAPGMQVQVLSGAPVECLDTQFRAPRQFFVRVFSRDKIYFVNNRLLPNRS